MRAFKRARTPNQWSHRAGRRVALQQKQGTHTDGQYKCTTRAAEHNAAAFYQNMANQWLRLGTTTRQADFLLAVSPSVVEQGRVWPASVSASVVST